MRAFPELTLGGVLIAPFVIHAGLALVLVLVLRPFLSLVGFDRLFVNPPLAQFSLYVLILALLIAFV